MTADERWEKLRAWLKAEIENYRRWHFVCSILSPVLEKMKQLEGK